MTGLWSICVPEATTNLITDPECTALDLYNATSATVTIDSTYARYGTTALKVVTGNATALEGVYTDNLTISAGTSYTFTAYLRGAGTVKLRIVTTDGGASTTTTDSATITLNNTGWTRYSVTATSGAGETSLSARVYTTAQQSTTFYCDGWQVEAKSYYTTFISGNQAGGRWAGLINSSTSSRAANYRLGGRWRDIEDAYYIRVRNFNGAGAPPLELNTQALSLLPGSIYENDKYQERNLNLVLEVYATSTATLHSYRKQFFNLIKPEAYGRNDPFLLAYTGNTRTVYGVFRYAGGWEQGELNGGVFKVEQAGSVGLRLLGLDPYWYEDDQQLSTLDYIDTLTTDYAFGRINGRWQRFGSGFDGVLFCVAIDYQRGRVYFGGAFSTANGVTVNGIAYWDGTTFQPLGAGTKGISGGNVLTISIAPNGDIWAGGDFSAAGGSATKGLAMWPAVGTSAPTVFNTATTFNDIKSIAIDRDYKIYIGGSFTVFGGTANASYIATSADQGASWAALTSTVAGGVSPSINSIVVDIDGTSIYAGGYFTGIGGVSNTARIFKYSGGVITALGSGLSYDVYSMTVDFAGLLYIGGYTDPTTGIFNVWNGSAMSSISTSYSFPYGYCLAYDVFTDKIYFGAVTSLSLPQPLYIYNGNSIFSGDMLLPSGLNFHAICINRNTGDIYATTDATGAPTVSGLTTISNSSTVDAYPLVIITGTTTAAASSTLYWLENQTTQQILYLNLAIQSGETITIDLSPNAKTITSNWRGAIYDNPLSTSDFANWKLAPGDNTIAAFMSGTTTGATMVMTWQVTHNSIDGAA